MTHLLRCHPLQPVDFVRGENCHLYDAQGQTYIDYESGSWASILGHQHPRVTEALRAQASRLVHLGVRSPNHLAEEAAASLLELMGEPKGAATFLSSGSEAVEFAIQAAKVATGRQRCLTLSETYLGAYGSATLRDRQEWTIVDQRRLQTETLEALLETVSFSDFAAFVLEPGGNSPCFARFPDTRLVQALAARVQAAGGLLVVNEVTTGLGRTGAWFAHETYGLRPDLIALGKSLGNGYPVSAVLVREPVARALEDARFYHAQSHQNNPLGCAIALEVLNTLKEEGWIPASAAKGRHWLQTLQSRFGSHAYIREIRGRGLLLGMELRPDAPVSGSELQQLLWKRRLLVGGYARHHPSGTGLRLDPSLTIGDEELALFIEALSAELG